jgi:predicted lipoprotein with Yx(FWY)xxD motif
MTYRSLCAVVALTAFSTPALAAGPSQHSSDSAGEVQLTVAEKAPYGKYLADAQGRALYAFSTDKPGKQAKSSCTGQCAEVWPPLQAQGAEVNGGPGVNRRMIGATDRSDGNRQITYDGWPLYTFAQDSGPGQIQGQLKHGFGGEWTLMAPNGQRIAGEQKASTESGKRNR